MRHVLFIKIFWGLFLLLSSSGIAGQEEETKAKKPLTMSDAIQYLREEIPKLLESPKINEHTFNAVLIRHSFVADNDTFADSEDQKELDDFYVEESTKWNTPNWCKCDCESDFIGQCTNTCGVDDECSMMTAILCCIPCYAVQFTCGPCLRPGYRSGCCLQTVPKSFDADAAQVYLNHLRSLYDKKHWDQYLSGPITN